MKKIKLITALLPIVLLCGCFGGRDINDIAIVMGIGIDSGEEHYYKSVVQTVVPKALDGGGGESFANFEGNGGNIGQCLDDAALKCGKYMHLSHTSALVIGEKIAENGIYEILDYFMRNKEFRSTITLAVSQENTEKVMTTENRLVPVPVSGVVNMGRRFRETSMGDATNVFEFVSDMMKKNCCSLVPIVKSDGENTVVSQSGVFKNGKMVAKISNQEARGVLWLKNKIEKAVMTVSFGEETIDVKIEKAETKLKPHVKGSIYYVADIKTEVSLLRDNNGVINAYGEENVRLKISETIKSEIMASFRKMQEIGCDVYGFGDMIYKKHPEIWNEQLFEKLDININAETKIRDAGSILKSAKKV